MRNDIVNSEVFGWRMPPERDELRIAIAGAGKMARLHLQTLKAMPGVRLVGICNRSSDAGQRLASEFGIERLYDDVDSMLTESAPHAVFVAVSHGANVAVSQKVLELGIPCLLEKPAGFTSQETRKLAALAESRNCLNMVGVNRRFYSIVNQALLAVMQLGPVRGVMVEAHEPILEYRSRRQFDSWVYDNWMAANSIHALDLLRLIGGEVVEVHTCRGGDTDRNSFSSAMRFANGALGTFVAHWNSAGGIALKIYGDGVTAEFGPLEEGFIRYDNGRRIKLRPDWSDLRFKPGLYAQNAAFLQAACDHFPIPAPGSDLEDQVKTMRLIEQIQRGSVAEATLAVGSDSNHGLMPGSIAVEHAGLFVEK